MFNNPCVILCGGKSSRMGEDKSLLPFKEYSSLAKYQYEKFSKIFSNVYISSKTNKFDFECNIIYDEEEIYSPMIALEKILEVFNTPVFIISVDTPFIKSQTINEMYKYIGEYNIVTPQTEYKHHLCSFFNPSILASVKELLENDNHKLGMISTKIDTKFCKFENEDEFMNLNKKNEYLKALNYKNN